jgi:tricorn protease
MVALTSETSASDGDIFPYRFRFAGLGPLIGKRTWGGVVGGGNTGLIDGSSVFVPRASTNAPTGEWIIEGEGVTPDIEVENDPASMLAGHDPQLERGVQEVLKRMAEKPMTLPKRPGDPVKTK